MTLRSRAREARLDGVAVLRALWHLRTAENHSVTVRVTGRPHVANRGELYVRPRVQLVSNVATLELATGRGAVLDIGERTFVNYGTSIAATKSIRIGADCRIGTHCVIADCEHHPFDDENDGPCPACDPVVIEHNVWLGGGVIVGPGVTIGADSVIGAGSVVHDDVPAGVIAAGIPAAVMRSL